jgi:hypothetical protein
MDLAKYLFIDGEFVPPLKGKTFENVKPTTGSKTIILYVVYNNILY